jgi:hypothetical protein
MSFFTPQQVRAAIEQHGTAFFDFNLQPVQPREGQWFCEFSIEEALEGEEVRDADLVEYIGTTTSYVLSDSGTTPIVRHAVMPEGADEDRQPAGDVLILQ